MGRHKHDEIINLKRGTLKRLAWKYKLSYATVSLLRARFYLFDELELEALFAAHGSLKRRRLGFLRRESFPDIHPPRPLHLQHSHYA